MRLNSNLMAELTWPEYQQRLLFEEYVERISAALQTERERL